MADEGLTMKAKARLRAARKGVATRAAIKATMKRWREIEEPSSRRMDVLLNMLLPAVTPIKLRWNPLGDNQRRRLKHNAEYGELIKFVHGGRSLLVLPDGYKRPQLFHPGYWEPLYEEFEEVPRG